MANGHIGRFVPKNVPAAFPVVSNTMTVETSPLLRNAHVVLTGGLPGQSGPDVHLLAPVGSNDTSHNGPSHNGISHKRSFRNKTNHNDCNYRKRTIEKIFFKTII